MLKMETDIDNVWNVSEEYEAQRYRRERHRRNDAAEREDLEIDLG